MDLLKSKKFEKLQKQIHSSNLDIRKPSKSEFNLSKNPIKKRQTLRIDKEQIPPVVHKFRENSNLILTPPSTVNISKSSLSKKKFVEPEVKRHTFLKPSFVPLQTQKLNTTKTSHIKNLSMQRNYPPFQNYAAPYDNMLNRSKAVSQMRLPMSNHQSVLQRSYLPYSLDKTAFNIPAYSLEEKQLIATVSNDRFDSLIKKIDIFKECPYVDDLEKISYLDEISKYYVEMYEYQMALQQQITDDDKQNKFEHIETWMNGTQTAQPEQVAYPVLNPGLQPVLETVENLQENDSESFINEEELRSNTSKSSDNIQKTGTYVLKDWTVLKERGGLKVAGTLTDVLTRKIIENNHVSDNIINLTKNNTVRTNTCTYMLNMNFVDPTNNIPLRIKKYFKSGKFPLKWKSIAKIWHTLPEERPTKKKSIPSHEFTTPVQSRKNNLERTIITRSVAKKFKIKRIGLFAKD